MSDNKIRKTINVSLQSKKYVTPINEIIQQWEKDGLNLSTEICENILLVDKLSKSPTFLNLLNVFELIEKMLKIYKIDEREDYLQQIEDILSKVIYADNSKLSEIFITLNQLQTSNNLIQNVNNVQSLNNQIKNSNTLKVDTYNDESQVVNVEKLVENTKNNSFEDNASEINNPIIEDDECLIPLDFLMNG